MEQVYVNNQTLLVKLLNLFMRLIMFILFVIIQIIIIM